MLDHTIFIASAYVFRHWAVPFSGAAEIARYVNLGVPPGSFITALLENNLRDACTCADDLNLSNLPAYVAMLHGKAPAVCWGSPEKVAAWLAVKAQARSNKEIAQ